MASARDRNSSRAPAAHRSRAFPRPTPTATDNDTTVWLSLVYTAVDRDDDHVTAPELGTRCTAGTLLPPYVATPNGNDCNDDDPTVSVALTVFADGDHDGFGAGPGQLVCTNGSPPLGFSTNGTDCDDADPTLFALLT